MYNLPIMKKQSVASSGTFLWQWVAGPVSDPGTSPKERVIFRSEQRLKPTLKSPDKEILFFGSICIWASCGHPYAFCACSEVPIFRIITVCIILLALLLCFCHPAEIEQLQCYLAEAMERHRKLHIVVCTVVGFSFPFFIWRYKQ